VALPTLSRDLARGAIDEFVDLVTRSLRVIVFVIGPIVALGLVLREPATTILFQHGRFSDDGVRLVAAALALPLLALPAEALMTILVRAFYANRDTRTPAAAAVLAVAFHVGLGVVAVNVLGWGLAGIALGIAIGSTVEAILLVVMLRRTIPAFDPWPLVRVGVPVIVGSLAAGLVALGSLAALDGATAGMGVHVAALVQLAVAGGLGGLAYLGVAWALRLPELGLIMRLMSDTLSRVRPA
jgi:putative peptidoglycan lipid II flippase